MGKAEGTAPRPLKHLRCSWLRMAAELSTAPSMVVVSTVRIQRWFIPYPPGTVQLAAQGRPLAVECVIRPGADQLLLADQLVLQAHPPAISAAAPPQLLAMRKMEVGPLTVLLFLSTINMVNFIDRGIVRLCDVHRTHGVLRRLCRVCSR